jgi:hypothetical protein
MKTDKKKPAISAGFQTRKNLYVGFYSSISYSSSNVRVAMSLPLKIIVPANEKVLPSEVSINTVIFAVPLSIL